MAALDLSAITTGLSGILSGVGNVNVGDLVGSAATSVAAGWLINGFNQKLQTDLGNILPHPAAAAAPTANAPVQMPTFPVLSSAQLVALTPAAQLAFFQAGGHVVG